jgi:hypothetical protein
MLVHEAFVNELDKVQEGGVSSFLVHYACCDALTHIAWAAVAGRTPQEGLDWNFDDKLREGRNENPPRLAVCRRGVRNGIP